MLINFKNWIIQESFDTVSDFLLNPEHRNKTWNELLSEFEASGGEIIGSGQYGKVFFHSNWPYVLKLYNDEYYTKFVRFAYRNPHPAFPKFFGPPQKVLPFYKRYKSQTFQYLVRMENLYPISFELFNLIKNWYWEGIEYIRAIRNGTQNDEIEQQISPNSRDIRSGNFFAPYVVKIKKFQEIKNVIVKNPELHSLFEGLYVLTESIGYGSLDVHQNNFMQRRNGEIVVVDPFWMGTNVYSDYQTIRDAETDRFGDYDPGPPNVIGGKLPKKKKFKKNTSKTLSNQEDTVPF